MFSNQKYIVYVLILLRYFDKTSRILQKVKLLTLDASFDGRKFNGVDNTGTPKSLLNEQYHNGTCHIL